MYSTPLANVVIDRYSSLRHAAIKKPKQPAMKNLHLPITMFAFLLSFFTAAAQNAAEATEYMKKIIERHDNVIKKYLSYNSAAAHGKKNNKVERLKNNLIDEVAKSKKKISGMDGFNGNTAYRDSAAGFMDFYYKVLVDDYDKIVDLDEITEKSYNELEAYLMLRHQVDKKLDAANDRMQQAQNIFAQQNNIKLVDADDELREKMKIVISVNEYYHKLYLIFFKPFLQDKNITRRINKGDVSSVKKDTAELKKYIQEAMIKLETAGPYDADSSLKKACIQLLQFYERKMSVYLKPLTDYYIANDKFEKAKKEYQQIKEPTQQNADVYNAAVNEINVAKGRYNETNTNMYAANKEYTRNWNKAVHAFLDRHMPE